MLPEPLVAMNVAVDALFASGIRLSPDWALLPSGAETGVDDDVDLDELAGEEQGCGADGGAGGAVVSEVVQHRVEVGEDLRGLCVEVVRVEEVALLVVGELSGDVDR